MPRMLCRESAEALSAAIEREAELRAALAEATARLQASAAGGRRMSCWPAEKHCQSCACCPGQAGRWDTVCS